MIIVSTIHRIISSQLITKRYLKLSYCSHDFVSFGIDFLLLFTCSIRQFISNKIKLIDLMVANLLIFNFYLKSIFLIGKFFFELSGFACIGNFYLKKFQNFVRVFRRKFLHNSKSSIGAILERISLSIVTDRLDELSDKGHVFHCVNRKFRLFMQCLFLQRTS